MMLNASFRLHLSNPRNNLPCKCNGAAVSFSSSRHRLNLRLPNRLDFASFTLHSQPSLEDSSQFTSTIGSSSSIIYQPLTHRHIQILTFIACTAAISATWLFCSAIPTLLAFKRAAESLEKLMDVAREELPDTMAAVRLSGMEISDLTMELSDLGQEITQGVRSSTRAVRLAEERLRRLTNMSPTVYVQEAAPTGTGIARPVVAETARGLRERIVKGRSALQVFFTFTRFSKMFFNYFTSRAKA